MSQNQQVSGSNTADSVFFLDRISRLVYKVMYGHYNIIKPVISNFKEGSYEVRCIQHSRT